MGYLDFLFSCCGLIPCFQFESLMSSVLRRCVSLFTCSPPCVLCLVSPVCSVLSCMFSPASNAPLPHPSLFLSLFVSSKVNWLSHISPPCPVSRHVSLSLLISPLCTPPPSLFVTSPFSPLCNPLSLQSIRFLERSFLPAPVSTCVF